MPTPQFSKSTLSFLLSTSATPLWSHFVFSANKKAQGQVIIKENEGKIIFNPGVISRIDLTHDRGC